MNFALIDPFIMAFVFFWAAARAVVEKRWENATTRLMIFVWFLLLTLAPYFFGAYTQRIVGRWLILLLGVVEVLFYLIHMFAKKHISSKEAKKHE